MSDPPLKPWVIIHMEGSVNVAHCDCMAGLGEACSHVGALLFAYDTVVQMKKSIACTSVPCGWIQPHASEKVEFKKGSEIDFPSSHKKKLKTTSGSSTEQPKSNRLEPPSERQVQQFYERLHKSKVKSCVLSTIPAYCDTYVPVTSTLNLPPTLDSLRNDDLQTESFEDILERCQQLFDNIDITEEQVCDIIYISFTLINTKN
jgi:hypothetical protein